MGREGARERSGMEGVAVAVMLLVAAMLCTQAPDYFDADGWRETTWHVVGIALALVGVVGIATEVGRLTGTEALGDFGAGVFLLLLAVVVGLSVEGWDDPPPLITGALKGFVAICVLFGIYGSVLGVANTIKRTRERRSQPGGGRSSAAWLGVVAALVGLATAAVNLYGAAQATPSSGP